MDRHGCLPRSDAARLPVRSPGATTTVRVRRRTRAVVRVASSSSTVRSITVRLQARGSAPSARPSVAGSPRACAGCHRAATRCADRTAACDANCWMSSTVQPEIGPRDRPPRPRGRRAGTHPPGRAARPGGCGHRAAGPRAWGSRRGRDGGSSWTERVVSARSTTSSIPPAMVRPAIPLDARSARSSMGEASTRLRRSLERVVEAVQEDARDLAGSNPRRPTRPPFAVSDVRSARFRRRFRSFTADSAAVAIGHGPQRDDRDRPGSRRRRDGSEPTEQRDELGERSRRLGVRDDEQEQRVPCRHLQARAIRGEEGDGDHVHVDEGLERAEEPAGEIGDPRQVQAVEQDLESQHREPAAPTSSPNELGSDLKSDVRDAGGHEPRSDRPPGRALPRRTRPRRSRDATRAASACGS